MILYLLSFKFCKNIKECVSFISDCEFEKGTENSSK